MPNCQLIWSSHSFDRPRPAATQVASSCTYIRAWLVQVSGHVELIHQGCHILSLPPADDTVLSRPASCAVPLCTNISGWLNTSVWARRTYTPTLPPVEDMALGRLMSKYRYRTGTSRYLWTINTGTGRNNSTPLFLFLVIRQASVSCYLWSLLDAQTVNSEIVVLYSEFQC